MPICAGGGSEAVVLGCMREWPAHERSQRRRVCRKGWGQQRSSSRRSSKRDREQGAEGVCEKQRDKHKRRDKQTRNCESATGWLDNWRRTGASTHSPSSRHDVVIIQLVVVPQHLALDLAGVGPGAEVFVGSSDKEGGVGDCGAGRGGRAAKKAEGARVSGQGQAGSRQDSRSRRGVQWGGRGDRRCVAKKRVAHGVTHAHTASQPGAAHPLPADGTGHTQATTSYHILPPCQACPALHPLQCNTTEVHVTPDPCCAHPPTLLNRPATNPSV